MSSSSDRGEEPRASGSRVIGSERTASNPARSRGWDAKRTLGFELPDAPATSLPPIGRQPSKRRFAPKPPFTRKAAAPVYETDKPSVAPTVPADSQEANDFGGLSLKFAILFLFLRFSFLHEFLTVKFRLHLYLIVFVGGIAYLSRGDRFEALSKLVHFFCAPGSWDSTQLMARWFLRHCRRFY